MDPAAMAAINNGIGGLRTTPTQLTALAQFLIIGIELLTPIFYTWNVLESGSEQLMIPRRNQLQDIDFIVVGGGSAGAVVAHRLSEYHNVLLIEAGGTPHPFTRIPLLTYVLHGKKPIDWKYRTVPQKVSSFGIIDKSNRWPSGLGLGGSSNINGMIYLRGNVQGFDTIANISGNPKWKMSNMLRIYHSLEDYNGYFDEGFTHGKGGRLSIEKSHLHPLSIQFLKSGEELGYKIRDPNAHGPVTEGFSPMDFYLKEGRRWSSYNGYLQDIMGVRKSLTVLKYATVTKVLIDKKKRAYGVEFVQYGRRRQVRARKEVILSAGAIQSPKLLMLSGIGPKAHLHDLGIKVNVNSPVGEILQDKYGSLIGPFVSAEGTSFLRERDLNLKTISKWAVSGTGPLQCARAEATYTISSSYAKKDGLQGFPDIHTYLFTWSIDERYKEELQGAFGIKTSILENYYAKAKGLDSFLQMVTVNKVFGTGTLRLKSKDPFEQPLLNPKYLENPRDLAVLLEAIKFSVKLVEETKGFRAMNASLLPIPLPGCEKFLFKSDSYWECFARHITLTAYKYSGTTPIGRDRSDPEAVVDPELRVFGINGLRVVDGSVLQVRYLSVNHVTIQAVAELASEMIIEHWKKSENKHLLQDLDHPDSEVNNFVHRSA